ncbi:C6 transcription factor [Penicillium vulpinum]|uniref:C6 transcription factor n=1 Tax=Penicillium vulpinum TaxID=29845 RepID=UPI0025491B6D|nr:C6 transcription factor [Penicillium vulpinum]KAJ5971817.1 C6 transcription factor [Penicillium vulpinum]
MKHQNKIRRQSTVCKECQRRRTKCSGGNPCSECRKRDCICDVNESSDKRRKLYLSMMEEELKYHQQFMDGFLKAIRTSNDADVHHIIDVVRSGSSTSEIQTAVNRVLTDNRSSYNDVPGGGPLRGWPKRKASKSATSDYLIAQLLDPSEIQSDGDSAQQPVSVPHELSRSTKEYLEKSENLEMLCE